MAMREIQLTQGKFALVDEVDFDRLSKFNWCVSRNGYAVRNTSRKSPGGKKIVFMHKEILGFPNQEADHIDGNKLDNRRANLRLCTRQQNCCNQRINSKNTSGAKGVHWCAYTGRWRARIKIFGRTIHLGRFDTVKDAAEAYNVAALEHFGQFARLN